MPVLRGDERLLSVPASDSLILSVRTAAKKRDMRLQEAVTEALQLWLITVPFIDESQATRKDRRTQRLSS